VLRAALVSVDTALLEVPWKPDVGGQHFVGIGVCSGFLHSIGPL